MTFKEASELLRSGATDRAIAEALSVSVASVRQYRLEPSSKSYRKPPGNWKDKIVRLAEIEIMKQRDLINSLRAER
jgi:hypothetical protein